jgi:acetyltransferase-like isoleucine patch superfamily enzyme
LISSLKGHLIKILSYRVFNFSFNSKGKNVLVSRRSTILKKGNISLGDAVVINEFSKVDSRSGKIILGNKVYIDRNVLLSTHGGNIEIGERSSLNPNCCVYGHGGLKIGKFVRIAAGTTIIPSNHGFERVDIPICDQPGESKGILIEDDVWIGTNCTILDGITIGHSSVIGAGSVVTKSVAPYSIMGGCPAKLIRSRK